MEVAGQWRREWAGAAEYGKVTEGGVTRRIARAMEVLQASGPGARVRVMRAAYHSSAGPGLPASSYMLHSSRRVLSSGFNLLSPSSFPNKPLEISSSPLDSFPDTEAENYKVTEPDDTEISEPSKWKVASSGNSLRMPSEESSSTDNASIIDIDSNRSPHKTVFRKYSYDSENSDIQSFKRNNARSSPLLDAPVTLSTLKYKSLLNGSNEWNSRRKSYSFENTSTAEDTMNYNNETLAMESSTDSGICKSNEVVNDQSDDNTCSTYFERKLKNHDIPDETFKDWLHKNRPSAYYKRTQLKPCREQDVAIEDQIANNITLQSSGKVSITVPITIEKDDYQQHLNEDGDRKVKKVGFCKTELHFAAESGKVNIIATDEKPPPSTDFRKRKSAFVPITEKFEKHITLFGDKNDTTESMKTDFSKHSNNEISETDENENTAATKSILKNKIPKPKPYLLGENMVLGDSETVDRKTRSNNDVSVPFGVSLINKQLQTERKCSNEKLSTLTTTVNISSKSDSTRTANKGPLENESFSVRNKILENEKNENTIKNEIVDKIVSDSIKNNKLDVLLSHVQIAKTRQLRQSDLMYFGIENSNKKSTDKHSESILTRDFGLTDNSFQSVRLIKQVSRSACNSEAESEDAPEYENINIKTNFAPIPVPRPRSKYNQTTETQQIKNLEPIIEQYHHRTQAVLESRRSRSRKYEEIPATRTRSEPAKARTPNVIQKTQFNNLQRTNSNRNSASPGSRKYQNREREIEKPSLINTNSVSASEDEAPLYVNMQSNEKRQRSQEKAEMKLVSKTHNRRKSPEKTIHTRITIDKNKHSDDFKNSKIHRTKKLVTPENSVCHLTQNNDSIVKNEIIKTSTDDKCNRDISAKKKDSSTSRPVHGLVKEKAVTPKENRKQGEYKHNSNIHNQSLRKVEDKVRKKSLKTNKTDEKSSNDVTAMNFVDKNTTETVHISKKPHNHGTPKRSEYIINYDDKNGTVSSICKVKSGHGSSKRKSVLVDKNKDSPKDIKIRNKMLDKTPLRK